MLIPSRFKLLGHNVDVERIDGLLNDVGIHGDVNYRLQKIRVDSGDSTVAEQTYLHEVTHLILNEMNENDLCKNEQFVDVFASMLHQVLTTGEFIHEGK